MASSESKGSKKKTSSQQRGSRAKTAGSKTPKTVAAHKKTPEHKTISMSDRATEPSKIESTRIEASNKQRGRGWMIATFVMALAFASFALYEYQPDVRKNVQAMLPFLRETTGTSEEKAPTHTVPLTVLYNAENANDKAQIQNSFVDSLGNPDKGLKNTKIDVTWIDGKSDDAKTYIDESDATYLPIAFVDSSIEQHPQFADLQRFLRKVEAGRYYFRLSPLHHLDLPSLENAHFKGVEPSKADIVVLEYGSFTCGYCKQMEEMLPNILKDYEGKVSFVYKHYDRGGPDSLLIQGAECAAEQNKFWEMHDALYKDKGELQTALNADPNDPTKAVRTYLEEKATSLGLNKTNFLSCFDSKKYEQLAQEQTLEAIKYGVDGTPAFFINGKFYGGAYPESTFKNFMDEALNADMATVRALHKLAE